MERRRRNEVEAQLRELARRGKPGALMGPLFDLSEELVQGGYPRDLLYEDLKQLLRELRAAGGQDY